MILPLDMTYRRCTITKEPSKNVHASLHGHGQLGKRALACRNGKWIKTVETGRRRKIKRTNSVDHQEEAFSLCRGAPPTAPPPHRPTAQPPQAWCMAMEGVANFGQWERDYVCIE